MRKKMFLFLKKSSQANNGGLQKQPVCMLVHACAREKPQVISSNQQVYNVYNISIDINSLFSVNTFWLVTVAAMESPEEELIDLLSCHRPVTCRKRGSAHWIV